jgi:hypothetical protein
MKAAVHFISGLSQRLIRKNKFEPSGNFNFEPGGTVYSRVEGLGSGNGMVGYAWNVLHEAWCGEHYADELIARLRSMAKQLPNEAADARKRAQAEGLDKAIIDRMATRLSERAGECERVLAGK